MSLRLCFSIVWSGWAAAQWLDNFVQTSDSEDDAISLIQTNALYTKTRYRSAADKDGPVPLELVSRPLDDIKSCLSEIAGKREIVEQDVKISDSELRSLVKNVKACSGDYGMEEEEYLHFMTYVRDHAPQRLLIWGLGSDSVVLNLLNSGGETLFLEPDPQWIAIIQQTTPGQALHIVHFDETTFNTTVAAYPDFLLAPHRADAVGPLQGQFCWDTVLVDSPVGSPTQPNKFVGRAVPIYTALADVERCKHEGRYPVDAEVSIFVHDCTRPLEDEISSTLFSSAKLQHEVGPKKLRQYCMTCSTDASGSSPNDDQSSNTEQQVFNISD